MPPAKTKPTTPTLTENLVRWQNSEDKVLQSIDRNMRTDAAMTTKDDAVNPYHLAALVATVCRETPLISCTIEPLKKIVAQMDSHEKKYKLALVTTELAIVVFGLETAMSFDGFMMVGRPPAQNAIKSNVCVAKGKQNVNQQRMIK